MSHTLKEVKERRQTLGDFIEILQKLPQDTPLEGQINVDYLWREERALRRDALYERRVTYTFSGVFPMEEPQFREWGPYGRSMVL
jgi:hypothetical protein